MLQFKLKKFDTILIFWSIKMMKYLSIIIKSQNKHTKSSNRT